MEGLIFAFAGGMLFGALITIPVMMIAFAKKQFR